MNMMRSAITKVLPRTFNSRRWFRQEACQSGSLLEIGTRRIFNEDHDMFRETVRKFFREEIVPYHSEWEKEGNIPREVWLKAGKTGILGVSIPQEYGGLGGDWLSSTITHEEQGYCMLTGPGFGLHSDVVMPYFTKFGTREQIERFIPDMVLGKKISSLAMTEPSAGSDLQGIKTHAKRDGDGWILNGSKIFISNGWMCDLALVLAVTDTQANSPARGCSIFIVEADNPGFHKGKKLDKIGLKAQDTTELFFDDCRLSPDSLLGGEAGLNKGFHQIMKELAQERLFIANISLAMAEGAFEETRSYVKQRKAFGKSVANFQVTQHTLADMKTELSAARIFTDRCNELHNEGKATPSTASMAKLHNSNLVNKIAANCVQLFGGYGFMSEYIISKCFVDARVQSIYAGTNEIMKEIIARDILKDP